MSCSSSGCRSLHWTRRGGMIPDGAAPMGSLAGQCRKCGFNSINAIASKEISMVRNILVVGVLATSLQRLACITKAPADTAKPAANAVDTASIQALRTWARTRTLKRFRVSTGSRASALGRREAGTAQADVEVARPSKLRAQCPAPGRTRADLRRQGGHSLPPAQKYIPRSSSPVLSPS